MTGNKETYEHGARLKALLEAYGADMARWPETDRKAFENDTDALKEARQAFEEARELDAVLSLARSPEAADGLAARIVSGVLENEPPRDSGNVVTLDRQNATQHRTSGGLRPFGWPSAALLAASLVIGVFLGQSELSADLSIGSILGQGDAIDNFGDVIVGWNIDAELITEDSL